MARQTFVPYLEVKIFDRPVPTAVGSIRTSKRLGQVGTLDFRVESTFGSQIFPGQRVTLHENMVPTPFDRLEIDKGGEGYGGAKIWEGVVNRVTQAVHTGGPTERTAAGFGTEVSCLDLNAIPGRVNTKTKTWPEPLQFDLELTVPKIVEEVCNRFLQDDAINAGELVKQDIHPGAFTCNYDLVSSVLDELARTALALQKAPPKWYWDINEERLLNFFPEGHFKCPVAIGNGPGQLKMRANPLAATDTLSYTQSLENYANRLIFRIGHYIEDPITEYFKTDGSSRAYNVTNPINSQPTITKRLPLHDEVMVQTVGIWGTDSHYENPNPPTTDPFDWYWNAGSNTVWAEAAPQAGCEIAVTYSAQDTRVIVQDATDEQSERRGHEGGSGVYGKIIDLTDAANSQSVLQLTVSYEKQLGKLSEVLRCSVWDEELRVQQIKIGQTIAAAIPEIPDADGDWLVRQIDMQEMGAGVLWRNLELVRGALLTDSVEYMQDLANSGPPAAQKTAQPSTLRTATGKYDAPHDFAKTDWTETLTTGGVPYLATANIRVPSQKGDYHIDWQFCNGNPPAESDDEQHSDDFSEFKPPEGLGDTTEDADKWKSIFPNGTDILIPSGETIGIPPMDDEGRAIFRAHIEFIVGKTRLRSIIMAPRGENGEFVLDENGKTKGPDDGKQLTTQCSWS